ncbi:hypothetical protein COO60DRAFT_1640750 [Scenedesmus sp. NREL 46B-D3]|nr:hypothetical protein COO60DRAFT_1640750 [Scenedesmus sp. NREL 46B-D3]
MADVTGYVIEAPQVIAEAEATLNSSSSSGVAAAATPSSPGSKQINWYQQWYPLAILRDLDPRRPTAARLLGIPVVMWRDGSGAWRAFEDRCPTGWEFNGAGACTRIPQMAMSALMPPLRQPALMRGQLPGEGEGGIELQGLLWVWPDASAEGAAAAAAAQPALIAELDQPVEWEARTDWFMREVPISMETVVENVSDPCHANFTHHKVQGSRSNEKGTDIKPLTPPTPAGFKMEQDSGRFRASFEFVAPCFLKYTFPVFGRVMAVYVVPTAMGYSRMITRFVKNKRSHPARPGLMGLVLKFMEVLEGNRVLEHALMRNKVLDGDNHVLHVQERQLLAEGVTSWQKNYFMPAPVTQVGPAAARVAAWRSWLTKFGADMPLLPKELQDLPPLMSRRQSLDRLSQHTQHCPDCQQALKRITLALPVTWAAAAAALLVAGVAAATGAPLLSWSVAGAAGAAVLLALAHRSLNKFKDLFIFTDYVHADIA